MERILLAHGSGGKENAQLIHDLFQTRFSNPILAKNEDAAVLPAAGALACSTDGFTVNPLFFKGGDIGKLAVAGSCNDVAMMGAKPLYLTCAFIIEEGFLLSDLEKIADSMAAELAKNGARVVTGDTKVVPKGSADGLFITTSAIGEIRRPGISANRLVPGLSVLVSGTVGDHGATVFAAREGMDLTGDLASDCASLWPTVETLLENGIAPVAMRDCTRGGLAAVLNEWAGQSSVGLEIREEAIPVKPAVEGICELLGFEATALANEGMFALAVPAEQEAQALALLGGDAAAIGKVTAEQPGKVILKSPYGTRRYLDAPTGELLPRIC